jgi:NAD(P) transhydrogenase subunit alpha
MAEETTTTSIPIGVPKETFPGERRVAMIPDVAASLIKEGAKVYVESGAGSLSGFTDAEYTEKGAEIVSNRKELFQKADMVLQVRTVGANPDKGKADLDLYRSGQVIIGHFEPLSEPGIADQVAKTGVTTYAMELIPRITRAQPMDALSSMATISGYQAVVMAAEQSPKMFPLMMTASGTISPAHVFVIGAGVAGLQAIATARRLGAVVKAFDVRPAVKEQVQSLGARFVELEMESQDAEGKGGYAKEMGEEFYRRQQQMMADVVEDSDVVITTAAVPGKKAPVLINKDVVDHMRPGSIIVDLAAERGGNCELTKPDETVEENHVKILGPTNLPSTTPYHASQMYSRNVLSLVRHILKNGGMQPNRDDEIIKGTMLTFGGKVVNEQVRELTGKKPETQQ